MATIQFFGAAGEVTGSAYLVRTERAPGGVLVDFGIFQGGGDAGGRNREPPGFDPGKLEAVVLTHGHLDHCGRLPVLGKHGHSGPIYATPASIGLTGIILRDSAALQEADAGFETGGGARGGGGGGGGEKAAPVLPLYNAQDAEETLRRLKAIPYGREQEIAAGISIRMYEAGHIIGSASVRMTVRGGKSDGGDLVIVFSGDIGERGAPILHDPDPPIGRCDAVLLESTYGDRDHRPREATLAELVEIVNRARAEDGKVLIPAFAVGRTQDLIYHFAGLQREGRIGPTDVFIDSPMATRASKVYEGHPDLHDAETVQARRGGDDPLDFPGLRFTRSREESQALNGRRGGCVIIAGSGMCTGGRILHHLRHGLPEAGTHVVFVGYQGVGTLGRELVNGARGGRVRIFGSEVAVNARVHTLGGFSAHAGQTGLVAWARAVVGGEGGGKPKVFLTHGEDGPRAALAAKLAAEVGVSAELPRWGDVVEV